MKKHLITALTLLCLIACSSSDKRNNANEHMHHSSFEELVNRFEDPKRESWQKSSLVLNKLGDLTNKTVADIGAGTGYFSFRLVENGANVIAVDVDQKFLDYINERKESKPIKTIKAPYDQPNIDYHSIDAALTVNTYHHIEDRPLYFREVFHALKDNGRLVIVDFKKEDTPHGPPSKMRVSGQTVMQELHKAGFSKIIIDISSLPEQYIVTAKKTKNPKTNALGF